METVNILGKYQVYIGQDLLRKIEEIIDISKFSKVVVITDTKIPKNYLNKFEKIIVPSGESHKNIETIQSIWKKMLDLKCDRKTLIINFGGGVVGDMGGFAAATFMRGVEFLQIPTTLLSAVDASVGGKVGIDFSGVKNLIGSFNQPIGVIVDIDTFKSLPDREFISGFGEIIKHGIIVDKDYFNLVTFKKPREFSKKELIEIIRRSCEIKAEIISTDEKESGNRKLLNFGHTVGHALESASLETENSLLHGEAVALGMIAEAKVSQELGLTGKDVLEKIEIALENAGLPIKYEVTDINKIMELISQDKKAESGKVSWTLIKEIGEALINQAVDEKGVKSAIGYISK